MKQERLLIVISFSFSIRYIVRTGLLEKLKQFCEPVIVIIWDEPNLINELRCEGYEVHLLPENKRSAEYAAIRRKIDICFDFFMLKSRSKSYQRKYLDLFLPLKAKLIRDVRQWYNILKYSNSNKRKKLFVKEKQLLLGEPNYNEISEFVDRLNIATVFTVTPFHQQEDLLLRICSIKGKRMVTSILSFDNITKRGWIPVNYDVYMVWNKYNKNELKRIYPAVNEKSKIYITGAPQFDFYHNPSLLIDKKNWFSRIGITDLSTKIILYAGGPAALFPNEPQYVRVLSQAIQEGKIKCNVKILFRCHPVDKIERWKTALKDCTNIIFESSWSGTNVLWNANITDDDIKNLCSTLAYTDVHINLCSTMTVDGSAFGKPQIAPYYDDVDKKNENLLRNYYKQEHFLPVIKTGGLALANSKEELIELVNEALQTPEKFNSRSNRIVEEIITYNDGFSTTRVAEVIRKSLVKEEVAAKMNLA